jgi:formylglycine-generating enzyme required for sulfatase activity
MGGGTPEAGPAQEVELSAYFIGKFEVTNQQFSSFTKATGFKTEAEVKKSGAWEKTLDQEAGIPPSHTWRDPQGEGHSPPKNYPVVDVNWADAKAYLKWARLRLPTMAQWEKAAAWDSKSKRARKYSWGDQAFDEAFPQLATRTTKGWGTWAVGSLGVPASPYGAVDMTSGAGEWCADGEDDQTPSSPTERVVDPVLGSDRSATHYFRGGAKEPCAGIGGPVSREFFYSYIGFRVALEATR